MMRRWVVLGLLLASCGKQARSRPGTPPQPALSAAAAPDAGPPPAPVDGPGVAPGPDACLHDSDCTMADLTDCCGCCSCHTLQAVLRSRALAHDQRCGRVHCGTSCPQTCPPCPPQKTGQHAVCHQYACVALP